MRESRHLGSRFSFLLRAGELFVGNARLLTAALVVLLLLLQYQLWFADGGYRDVRRIKQELQKQRMENEKLHARNQRLEAEVQDLKQGLDALEERAREELGMIKEDEIFFQIIDKRPSAEKPQL